MQTCLPRALASVSASKAPRLGPGTALVQGSTLVLVLESCQYEEW